MPILAQVGAALIATLLALIPQLLTAKLIKRLILHLLSSLARRTKSDLDNKLLQDLRAGWKDDL